MNKGFSTIYSWEGDCCMGSAGGAKVFFGNPEGDSNFGGKGFRKGMFISASSCVIIGGEAGSTSNGSFGKSFISSENSGWYAGGLLELNCGNSGNFGISGFEASFFFEKSP